MVIFDDELQAFKDLVYGEGFSGDVNPAPKGGTKRRAEATQDSSQVLLPRRT